MSTVDLIFLNTGLPPAETARRLASALEMELSEWSGRALVSGRLADQPGTIGGDVDVNVYGKDPEERSLVDGYDTVWTIRSTFNDEELLHREAEDIFARVVDRFSWPALLTYGTSRLIAAWHPRLGRHDFSNGTTTYEKDEDTWAPYALG
jgi:hypothetical protein